MGQEGIQKTEFGAAGVGAVGVHLGGEDVAVVVLVLGDGLVEDRGEHRPPGGGLAVQGVGPTQGG
ncbi:MAG: hypothetical protein DRI79_04890 [Chloroflexi bacterium]|nr:MAG: hypothetical protein DRI79_04890 [Chloroflexota bacterium]